ncbi:MAG TPA: hypothetical protein VF570_12170 [Pyrinomonadaceae bacterium]
MNNPACPVCGHVNRVGAAACEVCDARLYEPAGAEASEPSGGEREPFAPESGPSRAASDPPGPDAARPGEAIPAPPFKGAGDVISPMLAVYRKHFTLVGILVLVATLPEALLQYGLLNLSTSGPVEVADGSAAGFAAASGLLMWLLTMAGAALLSGSLVYAVVDVQRAGAASAGACLARGLKALPKVLIVSLISTAATIVGYVMLIIPGVILSLMFAVSVPAALVEGRGPIDALKRSRELTDGYKGLIFVTYFLWGLLVAGVGWLVTWSFANDGSLDMLPTLLLQTAVLGMLNSSLHVLTVYIYLGLLREHRSGFQANTFTPGPEAAAR